MRLIEGLLATQTEEDRVGIKFLQAQVVLPCIQLFLTLLRLHLHASWALASL